MTNNFDICLFDIVKTTQESNIKFAFNINYYYKLKDNENEYDFLKSNFVFMYEKSNMDNSSQRYRNFINLEYVDLYKIFKSMDHFLKSKKEQSSKNKIKVNHKNNGFLFFNWINLNNEKEIQINIETNSNTDIIILEPLEFGSLYYVLENSIKNRTEQQFLHMYTQFILLNNNINNLQHTITSSINQLNENNDKNLKCLLSNLQNFNKNDIAKKEQIDTEEGIFLSENDKYEQNNETIENEQLDNITNNQNLNNDITITDDIFKDDILLDNPTNENSNDNMNNDEFINYVKHEENQKKIELTSEKIDDEYLIFKYYKDFDNFKSIIEEYSILTEPFLFFIKDYYDYLELDIPYNEFICNIFYNDDYENIIRYNKYYSYLFSKQRLQLENEQTNNNLATISIDYYIPSTEKYIGVRHYNINLLKYILSYYLIHLSLYDTINKNNEDLYYLFPDQEINFEKFKIELEHEIYKIKYIFGLYINTLIKNHDKNYLKDEINNFLLKYKDNLFIMHDLKKLKIVNTSIIDQCLIWFDKLYNKINKIELQNTNINLFDNLEQFILNYINNEENIFNLKEKEKIKLKSIIKTIYNYKSLGLFYSQNELLSFDINLLKLLMLMNENNFECSFDELENKYKMLIEKEMTIKDILIKIINTPDEQIKNYLFMLYI